MTPWALRGSVGRGTSWWWLLAMVGAGGAALLGRAAAGGRMQLALQVDVVALLVGALVVLVGIRRTPRMSRRRRRWHLVLAGSFLLGALRSLLWLLGLPVRSANLVILILAGVAIVFAVGVERRRRRDRVGVDTS